MPYWPSSSGGTPGADGATWRSGAGAPSDALGANGDYYLNTTTGDAYLKTAGAYSVCATLKGSQGNAGADGSAGAAGAVWRDGSGAPGAGLGVNGDYYLDDATGNVYLKAAGSYSIVASIKGATGDQGPPGEGGTPATTVVSETAFDAASAVGTGTAYARNDHTHGTPATPTKTTVGLASVDNTSDAGKPVSTAQQAALDAKAPLASPAFTGTPTGITKAHVGLTSVDDTADSAKPVSTAQQTALDGKTSHSLATAINDFLVASGVGAFVKKTLAEVKTILGLGTAAYTASTDYAVAAKGVTGGDAHDHNGGDGAAIVEAAVTLADNVTNDVSITKHGFAPKAPNDTAKFLRGDATWQPPPAGSYTLVATLASDQATGADVNPVTLTGLVFTYAINSVYRIWFMGRVSPAAATTGCGFQLDLSSAVTDVNVSFFHQLASTGTLSGGHSIADDASVGVSSGMPANGGVYPVIGEGILRTAGNTGTAQLRFRSETTAVTTAKAGLTLVVEKIV